MASPLSTLRRGDVYLMGLNPGGHPDQCPGRIIDCATILEGTSAYSHECWQPKCADSAAGRPCAHLGPDGATHDWAHNRHQRNAIKLHQALGAKPGEIFATNAVFGRSTRLATLLDQSKSDLATWWAHCWPVHRELLSIVRPKMIVTLGYGERTSAFGLLRREAGVASPRRFFGKAWAFEARFAPAGGDSPPIAVIGVPHPSYHAPSQELVEALGEVRSGILAV